METVKTCLQHYWIVSEKQDENSDMLSINCKHCPIGANLTDKFKVENGEIRAV
jgi:hypothetical protein